MGLTIEQFQLFRHNGFLKLPDALPAATVTSLKEAIRADIRNEVEPVMRDRYGRVIRISNLWDRGGVFREVLTCPLVLDPLASLLGPNIEFIRNRHNHATLRLRDDNTDYLHRDVMQWTRSIVTVVFYLEETTVENGCTWVIPGSHLLPGVTTLRVTDDPYMQAAGVAAQAVPVPMPAGGMLVIDSMIIHGAGPNRTDGTRMSMTAGFHSVDEISDVENPKRVLVRGENIYQGNDYGS